MEGWKNGTLEYQGKMIAGKFFKDNNHVVSSSPSFLHSIIPILQLPPGGATLYTELSLCHVQTTCSNPHKKNENSYTIKLILVAALLVLVIVPMLLDAGTGPGRAPTVEDVMEAHQKLLKKYSLGKEEAVEYTYLEIEENEKEEKETSSPSPPGFLKWLEGLSLPVIIVIILIFIILFYFTFRGVPGFFRWTSDTTGKQQVGGDDYNDRNEEDRIGEKGYQWALELAKQGQYGKASIVLHKASIKKLQEYHWIPSGKNFTNNDIRRLIQDSGTGIEIFTPFSQLAAAAERAAFKRENPGGDAYTKLRQMYESTFLNMNTRDR